MEVLGLAEVHHGINASTSRETMRFLADHHIQLNVCPTSNVMLGYVKDYQHHPIKTLVENEYLLLYQAGTLSAEQLDAIRHTGLNT